MMMNYKRGYYAINQNGKIFGATTSMQQLGVWGDAFKKEKLLQLQNAVHTYLLSATNLLTHRKSQFEMKKN